MLPVEIQDRIRQLVNHALSVKFGLNTEKDAFTLPTEFVKRREVLIKQFEKKITKELSNG
jgi:hypothetical protein